MLGQERPESGNLTFCNKFEPTILEGQLCYSLDVAKFKRKPTKVGKKSGLFLLIDPIPNVVAPRNNQELFKVYVHTLAQHTSFGHGVYSMHILKKMTGTKSFLQLQDNQKNCQVNDQELCQTKNFLEAVGEMCNCVPWPLAMKNNNNEVSYQFNCSIVCLFFRTSASVDPRARYVLQIKLFTTTHVWFHVLVSTLMFGMIPASIIE